MSEQSDEALVELRGKLIGAVFHLAQPSRGDVFSWFDDNADEIIRAVIPILNAREASARAEGKREGIEEAAKVAEASPFNNGLNDAPSAIATAIRARLGKKP